MTSATDTVIPTWMNIDTVPSDLRAEIAEQIEHLRGLMPELVRTTGNLNRLAARYNDAISNLDLPDGVHEHFAGATGYDELVNLAGLVMVMFMVEASVPTEDLDVLGERIDVDVPWA